MYVAPVCIEELHSAGFRANRPELLAGPERAVDHVPVARPPELRSHEGPALAGLDVLELDDLEDGAVHLDVISVLELIR